jgi:hypothetical protein
MENETGVVEDLLYRVVVELLLTIPAGTEFKKDSLFAAVVRGESGGTRAVARQATQGFMLRLRPYSRPVGVAPRQRRNQAQHNPIK